MRSSEPSEEPVPPGWVAPAEGDSTSGERVTHHTTAVSHRRAAGRWLVLAAAVLWSVNGLFAKSPVLAAWDLQQRGVVLAFWRALFAGLLLVPLARRPRWTWRLVPSAAAFAAMNVSFLMAITLTTAANAIWLQYTAPVWITLIGVVWLRERPRRADVATLLVCMSGVILIVTCEMLTRGTGRSIGIAWAIASGVAYALVVVSLRGLRDEHPVWITSWNHLATAALLAPWVLTQTTWPIGWQWLWLALFGIVQMGIPYVLFTKGLQSLPAHEAGLLGLLEPVLVPIWVLLAFPSQRVHELPAWWTLAGGALILAALVVRYRGRTETSRKVKEMVATEE